MKTAILRPTDRHDILLRAAKDVAAGALIVFPTDTIYGIGCSAYNQNSSAKIYTVKKRPDNKPLPVLAHSRSQAALLCRWNAAAERLANSFWPGALTIILPVSDFFVKTGFHGGTVGLRVPAHRFLLEFIELAGVPFFASSANISGEPVVKTEKELLAQFSGQADYIMLGNPPQIELESSVVDLSGGTVSVVREGAVAAAAIIKAAGTF